MIRNYTNAQWAVARITGYLLPPPTSISVAYVWSGNVRKAVEGELQWKWEKQNGTCLIAYLDVYDSEHEYHIYEDRYLRELSRQNWIELLPSCRDTLLPPDPLCYSEQWQEALIP